MSDSTQVKVPDIGDADGADIIEVLVAVGDKIEKETPLIVLETDKATMEVPSSHAGIVKSINAKVGEKVSHGDLILELTLETSLETNLEKKPESNSTKETKVETDAEVKVETEAKIDVKAETKADTGIETNSTEIIKLVVPDIGDASDVDVIEVLISDGQSIEKEQGMIVLETDKATMEVPSESAGKIVSITVKVGDKVSQGDVIGEIEISTSSANKTSLPAVTTKEDSKAAGIIATPQTPSISMPEKSDRNSPVPDHPHMKKKVSGKLVHASPSVRRFARELGADLSEVKGTGVKSRIMKEDVQKFIKFELSRPKVTATTGSFSAVEMPKIDHAKWGEVENKPLTRIQKISSINLHRNWVTIPHVTQHEDADITDLDAFRKALKEEALKEGTRLTPLAFIMKGLVHSLKAFPKFNSSLSHDGEELVLKKYYHIGVAVETPDGLTVPVIRDVDKKGIYQLADELGEISAKAREKKLGANDMQGSSFTLSSLGGIGGTSFSPIVKWPDVAILGLSRNKMQPVWNGKEFVPRMMLPMSLSYDHRVIDGADAARFVVHLAATLKDIRRVLLK
ncbi:MAG: pyruvate dehydrogenase E2 component (dihydrolipoamide acetyltransferase) [Polaribacter sp.]|jgi:pyruvate dehydrogenase E2 component (dihydrolipoamide acetyltransferase)